MKQFQYSKPGSGLTMGPYDRDEAEYYTFALSEWLGTAAVGDTAADTDGDIWVRLPDVKTVDEKHHDERLERIATAALQGLCANSYDGHLNRPLSTASYAEMAKIAVTQAHALIAELDKQA
jgi:hypothetical protein